MPETCDKTRWGLVALLFLCGLLAALQFAKVSLTLGSLAAQYEQSVGTVSVLVSLVSVIGVVLGVVAGEAVARVGTRPAILWALILGAILSLAQATLPPLWLMVPLRIAEGLSHLALVVAIPPVMASAATERDRPIAMAIWAMFFGVAFSLASLLFPALMALGGVPLIFAIHGCGMAVLGVIFLKVLPKSQTTPLRIRYGAAHRIAYTSVPLSAPGLIFLFYTLQFVASVTFLPNALNSPGLATLMPLLSLAGTFAAGVLCRHFGPVRVMVSGYLGVLAFTVPLFAGWVWAAIPMFLMIGLIPGACFAAIPRWNAQVAAQSRASGVLAQLGNVGTGGGTPLFALAMTLAGVSGLLAVHVALCLIGLAVTISLGRKIQRSPSD